MGGPLAAGIPASVLASEPGCKAESGSGTMRTWISSPPAVVLGVDASTRVARGTGELPAPDPRATIPTSRAISPTPAAAPSRPPRSPRRSRSWCAHAEVRSPTRSRPRPRRRAGRAPTTSPAPTTAPVTRSERACGIPSSRSTTPARCCSDANPMEAFLALHEVVSMLGVGLVRRPAEPRARGDRDARAAAGDVAARLPRSRPRWCDGRDRRASSRSAGTRRRTSTSSSTGSRSCSRRRDRRSARRNVARLRSGRAQEVRCRSRSTSSRSTRRRSRCVHGHERPQRVRPLLPQRPRPHRRRLPHHRPRPVPEPRGDRRVRDGAAWRPPVHDPHVGRARRRPHAPGGRSVPRRGDRAAEEAAAGVRRRRPRARLRPHAGTARSPRSTRRATCGGATAASTSTRSASPRWARGRGRSRSAARSSR